MKAKSVKKGSLNLKVKIIDWTPINNVISKVVGEEVECRLGNGFIENIEAIFDKEYGEKEIKTLIIDKECCGKETERKNYYVSQLNNSNPFCLNVINDIPFFRVSRTTEFGKSVAMFPSYFFSIDIDDIKNCLTGEEKSLFDFMESRYSYNSRISSNEINILRLVYHNDIEAGNKEWMQEEMVVVNEH